MKDGPRTSEAPTEKRTRPTVDLWKDNYAPPAQERINVEPGAEDASGSFNRSRMVRGPMATEAEQLQPPRRAGRGSSGDPADIAPARPARAPGDPTPAARPRPKSGETSALGSASPPVRGTKQPAEMGPDQPLLEPRRRPPTASITHPSAAGAPPTQTPAQTPAPAPTTRASGGTPALPPPTVDPTSSNVTDAIQAANDAARGRKALDRNELAEFSGALDFGGESAPSDAAPSDRRSLSETTADENPAATAQAALSSRQRGGSTAAPEPGTGASSPHMPHYLVTQVLGEPVALSRNQVVRIGRGEDNEVIFPLSQVSRHHAEVRFDAQAGAYVIVDRNSINGTFVNGKAVKRRRLADGDRIGIGPFAIVYRASTGGHRLRAMDETDVIRPGSLAGELTDMPIPDVARFIEALRKTGELTVISATGERGTVLFRDGQAVHAEFKVSLGPPAAVAVFRLKAGNFRFAVKAIELTKATISQPLGTLLAEAANATG